MHTWILIVSYGNHELLPTTVVSIPQRDDISVIVSYEGSIIEEVPGIIFIKRKKQPSPFHHYKLLSQELGIADDDHVMICEEGDVFFPDAFDGKIEGSFLGEHVLFEGFKVPGKENEQLKITATQLGRGGKMVFMDKKLSKHSSFHPSRRASGFSGTITQGKYFNSFFKWASSSKEAYMKYIKSLPNYKKYLYPFLLHRV